MKAGIAIILMGLALGARAQTVTLIGAGSVGDDSGPPSHKTTMGPDGGEMVTMGVGPGVKIITLDKNDSAAKEIGRLGLAAVAASDEIRDQLSLPSGVGLTVRRTAPGSPAAKAGIKPNDILTQADDQWLMDALQLSHLTVDRKEGDEVRLTYIRKGKPVACSVVLEDPQQQPNSNDHGSSSISLDEILGRLSGIGKNATVNVYSVGPNGTLSNVSGEGAGAVLTGILKSVPVGAGGNVTAIPIAPAVGGESSPGANTADVMAEVAKALREAGVRDGQPANDILKQVAETLKPQGQGKTGR